MKVAKYQKVLFLSHFQLNNCLDFSILNNVAYIELLHTCSNLKKISFLSKSSQKQTFKEFQNSNCLNRDNFVIVWRYDLNKNNFFWDFATFTIDVHTRAAICQCLSDFALSWLRIAICQLDYEVGNNVLA